MSKQQKHPPTISPEPYWLLESMVCMNYVYALDCEGWLDKMTTWGRKYDENFLVPYRNYRDAMRAKLQPVMEQYPVLMGYVDTEQREPTESLRGNDSPILLFLVQMQGILEADELPPEDELEKKLNRAFEKILGSEMQESPDIEPEIHGLSDVMEALKGWEGKDTDKFKLLRLYSERREVIEQLWSLRETCAEIGRSCLPFVQERFDACMDKLQRPGELEAILDMVGVQCGDKFSGRLTPLIMQYDRITVIMKENYDSESDRVALHFGLEFFYLHELRTEDLYNNDRLLEQRLKTLGDSTRLKILRLLAERPCYVQEMAKELELTPATILYHLGIMTAGELIETQMTNEKKKIYYQLRKERLQELSDEIRGLTLSPQEREAWKKEREMQNRQQKQGGPQWVIQK